MADAFFTEQHELVRKLAREFAETELTKEVLDKVEEEEVFPEEILDKMAKAGFFGIKVPKQYGGQGGDARSYVIVMEEIARVSGVASIYVSSPNSLSGGPFLLSGNAEQKEKYLRPVVTGEKKVCFALTEPGAGSDAGGMQTTAVKDGDYYILNGRKTFITMAPLADWAVVYAKTDMSMGTKGISAFIVDMKQEGVSCGKPEKKMGVVGCATSDIILENVRVHKDNLLGQEGKGFINAMKTLDTGRMGVAAQSIGVAQGCLDEAIKYAKERKQFGRPIAKFQAIAFMLAEMATKLEAAKNLVYKTAWLIDNGQDASMAASMAKFYASEVCNEIAAKTVQIHGGYGFIKDYKIERMFRDCRVFTIYEGTSQVQQMVISGKLLK
ncbi:acyl-CoA dehydrogenase family protein [Clostridium sp. AM42-4]|uniref:acyl-CoA dehydrogenase family protein n=1 Tax=Clostridium sp. AM42-4 TaxID=2292305 RepID=UPI000E4D82B8|nr:acyl-CoA dehydrogenase family protein [Clostridium sp. AM42-4]RHS83106.1 acyl-CoA dehydrogenase [Clostridium sp. AM42-4]HBM46997.1 acyl-CoA dehydrogenase [Lachnoclostridium sp.]